jgi:hypothetical protein
MPELNPAGDSAAKVSATICLVGPTKASRSLSAQTVNCLGAGALLGVLGRRAACSVHGQTAA